MYKVYSSQYNYRYGNNVHFPYSIATLVAYLQSKENIRNNFQFKKTVVFRERVDEYIEQCKKADILLCSCYVWNWEITTKLAKEVKKNNPTCLIIFGGPQVPENTSGFFEKYPYVDILVHGEGEFIIENIFNAYLKNKNYSDVKGISTKEFRTMPQERILDFSLLPSPYLTNTIWKLVDKEEDVRWDVSWETNRGCPFACTFCDWGSATFTKLRNFSEEQVFKEIEWFMENKIAYIYCCDANFGIYFERDLRIARKLKEVSLKNKFPETFIVNWTKNSSEKIIPIAKELHEGGLLAGVTLSVQSLDENTLDIIKRANIKFDKFSNLAEEFRSQGLPTYSELIRGLPGETLDTFKQGLENMVGESNIDTIYIFHCSVLPNAPMNLPEYKDKYQIKTIHSPIFLRHTAQSTLEEFENIVISTSSFTFDELKEMYLFSWLILTFQSLGILEYIPKYYNKCHSLPFIKFYEELLEFCRTQESIFSEEYKKVIEYMNIGYNGNGWNHFDSNLGDINWAIEEAAWLRLASKKNRLIQEIYSFLQVFDKKLGYNTPKNLLKDLVNFQVFLLTTEDDSREIKSETFAFNWKEFFINNIQLKPLEKNYFYKNQILESNHIEWCKEVMWYGRKATKHKFNIKQLEEGKSKIIQISK